MAMDTLTGGNTSTEGYTADSVPASMLPDQAVSEETAHDVEQGVLSPVDQTSSPVREAQFFSAEEVLEPGGGAEGTTASS